MLNLWSFSELGQINVCYVYYKIPNVSATDSPLFHSLAIPGDHNRLLCDMICMHIRIAISNL